MTVQWFPGHMTKALRQIEARIKEVDMVIECRDARIPYSSSNPEIERLLGQKPRLIVLTKKDLANPDITADWINHLKKQDIEVIVLNVLRDNVRRLVVNGATQAMKEKHARDLRRGIKPRIIRALIVGVPNVGKSTLMNRLANRKVAEVSNRPGVTMALKKVNVSDKLEVIDSPGLLWPRFEHDFIGYHLALCLSVKETGFQTEDVVSYGLERLSKQYLDKILDYYKVDSLDDVITQAAINQGEPLDRGPSIVLRDIQNHRFGRVSWETYDFIREKVLENK